MFSYVQYLYRVAVVATADWGAPDGFLIDKDGPRRSRWLVKNCTVVRLNQAKRPSTAPACRASAWKTHFSLFAQTVKRRRLLEAGGP